MQATLFTSCFTRRAGAGASLCALLFIAAPGGPAACQTWPFALNPVVTRSFGSLENGVIHGGLDIPGTRTPANGAAGGTAVRAVANATIRTVFQSNGNGTGFVSDVCADDGTNSYVYSHIERLLGQPELAVGQALVAGQNFARVIRRGTARSGSFGHIHLSYSNTKTCAQDFFLNDSAIDPLRFLFPANTVKEDLENRSMTYNPRDGRFRIYGQTGVARVRGRYIKGDVDLMGEMRDDMGGTMFAGTEADNPHHLRTDINLFKGYSGTPAEMRYSVREPTYVRNGPIAERKLETFDQKISDHRPRMTTTYVHPERSLAASDPGAPLGERGGNSDNYTYKLTATDGTRPDRDRYWNTDSLWSTGGADGSAAVAIDSPFNGLAKFQDGVYEVFAKSLTVNGQIGGTGLISLQSTYDVLLNNYLQTAFPAKAAGEAPLNLAPRSNERNPGPEQVNSPGIEDIFQTGEDIYIKGAQYVDDLTYHAYAVPYQPAWRQDDLFNALCTAVVRSDDLGIVDGQLLCPGGLPVGTYNLLIDYDRSFDYSWTLDGVGTFKVVAPTAVPEPGKLVLATCMVGTIFPRMLLRNRRRHRRTR